MNDSTTDIPSTEPTVTNDSTQQATVPDVQDGQPVQGDYWPDQHHMADLLTQGQSLRDQQLKQSQRDNATFADSLLDVPRGVAEGGANLFLSAARLGRDIGNVLPGGKWSDPNQFQNVEWTRTRLGDFTAGATEFASLFIPAAGELREATTAYDFSKLAFMGVKATDAAAGAVTDFILDDHKPRLSNAVEQLGQKWNSPTLTSLGSLLAQEDGEGAFESRLKRAAEGIPLGITSQLIFNSIGYFGRSVFAAHAGAEETAAQLYQRGLDEIKQSQTVDGLYKNLSSFNSRISRDEFEGELGKRLRFQRATNPDATIEDVLSQIQLEQKLSLTKTDDSLSPAVNNGPTLQPLTKDPQFSGLNQSAQPSPVHSPKASDFDAVDTEPKSISVGDFVQWDSQGVAQFSEPLPVTGKSDDGSFVFVDNKPTGIPVEQVRRVDSPTPFESPRSEVDSATTDALNKSASASVDSGPSEFAQNVDEVKANTQAATEQPDIYIGMTRALANGKVVIALHERASVLTLSEELLHEYFLHNWGKLPDEMRSSLTDALNLPDGTDLRILNSSTSAAHETLAQQFLKWGRDATLPDSDLDGVFSKFRDFLKTAYEVYDQPTLAADMHPAIRAAYETLIGARPSPAVGSAVAQAVAEGSEAVSNASDATSEAVSKANAATATDAAFFQAARSRPVVPPEIKERIAEALSDNVNSQEQFADATNEALQSANLRRVGVGRDYKSGLQAVEDQMLDFYAKRFGNVQSNALTAQEASNLAEVLGTGDSAFKYMGQVASDVKNLAVRATVVRNIYGRVTEDLIDAARLVSSDSSRRPAFDEAISKWWEAELYRKSASSEIAKALQSFNIPVTPLDNLLGSQNFVQLLKEGKYTLSGQQIIQAVAGADSPSTVQQIFSDFEKRASQYGAKLWDVHHEFWLNALMSGPHTQVAINAMKAFNSLLQPATIMAGGALTGDLAAVRSGMRIYTNLIGGFRDAFTAIGSGMRAGDTDAVLPVIKSFLADSPVLKSTTEGPSLKAITADSFGLKEGTILANAVNWMGTAIRLPQRLLTTSDELFSQLNYRAYSRELGWQEASNRGLIPGSPTFADFIDNYVAQGFGQNGEALNESALAAAKRSTFTQDLVEGSAAQRLQSATKDIPALKLLFPFIKVPVNIMKAIRDYTPGADMLFSDFRKELVSSDPLISASARGRLAVGAAFWSTAVAGVMAGKVTGAGPKDPEQRAQLLATGWRPYSYLTDDGNYIDYSRLEPIAPILGMTADFADMMKHADEPAGNSVASAMTVAIAQNLSDKTYLNTLNEVLDALHDPNGGSANLSNLERLVANRVATYVPSALPQFAPDDYLRNVRGMMDVIIKKIPGLSETLPAKRDLFGEKIATPPGWVPFGADTTFANVASPARFSTKVDDATKQELANLQYGFSSPPKALQGVDLTQIKNQNGQDAYDRWLELHGQVQIGGQTIHDALNRLVASKHYQNLPQPAAAGDQNNDRVKAVREVIGRYRDVAQRQMLREYPAVNDGQRIIREAHRLENVPTTQDRVLDKISK